MILNEANSATLQARGYGSSPVGSTPDQSRFAAASFAVLSAYTEQAQQACPCFKQGHRHIGTSDNAPKAGRRSRAAPGLSWQRKDSPQAEATVLTVAVLERAAAHRDPFGDAHERHQAWRGQEGHGRRTVRAATAALGQLSVPCGLPDRPGGPPSSRWTSTVAEQGAACLTGTWRPCGGGQSGVGAVADVLEVLMGGPPAFCWAAIDARDQGPDRRPSLG
jgi:hypothetical protein